MTLEDSFAVSYKVNHIHTILSISSIPSINRNEDLHRDLHKNLCINIDSSCFIIAQTGNDPNVLQLMSIYSKFKYIYN